MKFFRWLICAALGIATGCRNAGSTETIAAVSPFELPRYLGVWYEVARMPVSFERGMGRVTARYFVTPDGTFRVENRGFRDGRAHTAHGIIRQMRDNSGELEVSFFRPFYGKYRIVALEKDYSAALVVSGTKDYAWILVRTPGDAKRAIARYLPLLKQWGFDTAKLEFPLCVRGDH